MKIKMTATTKGSPCGLKVKKYEKGQSYDVPESLARVFIDQMKVATGGGKAAKAPDNKAADVPENKS